jgi:hypothetical protein
MSYIGNVPTTAAFLTDTFSGNGSTTAFTMSIAPATTSSVLVSITGVLQSPDTYSVSGTTLTFSAAPPSGTNNISARYLGIPASGVTTTAYRTVTNFTATAGQTSFSVPSYTVGYIDVYRNGVRLVSTDYTATTGTTVVLANACTSGDAVVTESFYVSSVLNAIPATAASISSTYLASNLTITTPTIDTITSAASTALTLKSAGTTGLTIDTSQNLAFNSGYGSVATAYGCRAWVNFNGTGTVAIRGSANVSSITDNGVGSYTVNFTTAMPDANYSVCGNGLDAGNGIVFQITSTATGNVRVQLTNAAIAAYDSSIVTAAIFR